jgi:hypothetical protein
LNCFDFISFLKKFENDFTEYFIYFNFILSLAIDSDNRKKFFEIGIFDLFLKKNEYFYDQLIEKKLDVNSFIEFKFFKIDFDNLEMFIQDFKEIELIYENLLYLIYFFEKNNKFDEFQFSNSSKKIFKKHYEKFPKLNIQNNLFDLLKEKNKFDINEFNKKRKREQEN